MPEPTDQLSVAFTAVERIQLRQFLDEGKHKVVRSLIDRIDGISGNDPVIFTIIEWNDILQVVGGHPYAIAAPMIGKINAYANAQFAAPPPASPNGITEPEFIPAPPASEPTRHKRHSHHE